MNGEQIMLHGTGDRGREIWTKIKQGHATHNGILDEMRTTQKALAAYAKYTKMDQVQKEMVGEIKLLETFAWRIYMFGEPNRFEIKPGMTGEFAKRLRTDRKYHQKRDREMIRFGEAGCQFENNVFSAVQRPCLRPDCKHKAIHYAHKAIKREMRLEWEREILSKYKY